MPIYEYQCEGCQHHFEALQKISDASLRKCPECGKTRLKRLISSPVFRLKGSGWYETDFKSDKENRRNLAVEKDEAAAPSPDSTAKAADGKSADGKAADGQAADGKAASGTAESGTATPKAESASVGAKPAARRRVAASRKKPASRPRSGKRGKSSIRR